MDRSIEHIIGGCLGLSFTVAALLLLLPAFRSQARWKPGNAPMSLRSRLILPFFPLAGTFIVLDVLPNLFMLLAVTVFAAVWLSYRADDRAYDRKL